MVLSNVVLLCRCSYSVRPTSHSTTFAKHEQLLRACQKDPTFRSDMEAEYLRGESAWPKSHYENWRQRAHQILMPNIGYAEAPTPPPPPPEPMPAPVQQAPGSPTTKIELRAGRAGAGRPKVYMFLFKN